MSEPSEGVMVGGGWGRVGGGRGTAGTLNNLCGGGGGGNVGAVLNNEIVSKL